MNKNASKKKKRNAVVSVVLVIALLITGIFAFLWSSDSKTNRFTVGKVDIVLHEGEPWDNLDEGEIPEEAENLLPGQEVPKAPTVENIGKNPAHIFLVVGIPVAQISDVFTDNGTYTGADIGDIIVQAYGIQENYAHLTDSEQIWNSYVSKTGIASMFGENITSTNNIELFACVDMNEENWEQMKVLNDYSNYDPNATSVPTSNVYQGTIIDPNNEENNKSYHYYFFKYKNTNNNAILDVNDITEALFTHVKLIDGIGEEEPPLPYAINFYVKNNETETISNSNPVVTSSLNKANGIATSDVNDEGLNLADCRLVHTEIGQGETKIDTLPMDNSFYEQGCRFGFVKADVTNGKLYATDKQAYSGMVITEDSVVGNEINFLGLNTEIASAPPANYLVYSGLTNDFNGMRVVGANSNEPNNNYPSAPTEVNIPMYVYLERTGDEECTILNGYFQAGTITPNDTVRTTSYFPNLSSLDEFKISENVYKMPVTAVHVSGYGNVGYTKDNYYGNALISIAQKLVVPDTVTNLEYIGNYSGDTNYSVLEEINIPNNCEYLGATDVITAGNRSVATGFYNNPNLTTITGINNGELSQTLKILGNNCFARTGLSGEITLPESIEIIGPEIFKENGTIFNNNLDADVSKVFVPSNCQYIINEAFYGVPTVNFANSNWKMYHDEWGYFRNLGCSNININDTIENFINSEAYISLNFADNFSSYLSITFTNVSLDTTNRVYCNTCHSSYWSQLGCKCNIDDILYDGNEISMVAQDIVNATIKEGVTNIPEKAFAQCESLTTVSLPDSIINISNNAFLYCSHLANITIPNNVTSIGDYAFGHCTNLTTITIPNSVISIGYGTFSCCTNLANITLGNSVTNIGNCAFENCTSLTSITIPNSVTTMGYDVFSSSDNCVINISLAQYNNIIQNNYNVFNGFYGNFNYI